MTNLAYLDQDKLSLSSNFTQDFLDTLKSPGTQKEYKREILQFFSFCYPEITDISQIKLTHIQNVSQIQMQKYIKLISVNKKNTINRKLSSLSSLYDWLAYTCRKQNITIINEFKDKYFKENIVSNQIDHEEETEIDIFTKEELSSLFSLEFPIHRDYVLLKFMVNTGVRRNEVETLMPTDFFRRGNEWAVRIHGKGRKTRVLYIHDEIKELIDSVTFSPNTPIFHCSGSNIYRILQKHCGRAGITKQRVSPHILRHTFTSLALEADATLEQLREALGHKKIETTMKYVHLIDSFGKCATRKVFI